MAQDYYTLEEAATIVRMSPDELKQLARKGELRSFQDRGTWRFRVADIQELARSRGVGSDPELVLGEAPSPKPADSPAPRSPAPPKSREAEVFDFDLPADDESVGIGNEFLLDVPGSGRKSGGGSRSKVDREGPKSSLKSGPKSPGPKSPGPKSPGPKSPKPGSDSDVRLVADGSDVDFHLSLDSESKLVDDSAPPLQAKQPARGRTGMTGMTGPHSPGRGTVSRRSSMKPPASPVDSGVRLVPMDSDSDVRIVGGPEENELALGAQPPRSASDSDIRLEQHQGSAADQGMLTEEINLDEELRKEEAQRQSAPQAKIRPKPPSAGSSPFELSEADLQLPASGAQSKARALDDSSISDFELTPAADSSSPLDLGSGDFDASPVDGGSSPLEPSSPLESSSPMEPSSDEEFHLDLPGEEAGRGGMPSGLLKGPGSTGMRLDRPADSGISLEQGGDGSDEIEFELSLDAGNTPKPQAHAPPPAVADSDSEFELTLDSDDAKLPSESDSEFELTLDSEEPPPSPSDSDSEFELTLDDSGGLPSLDEEVAPAAKTGSGEKDIFDTDFDVPTLDDESGSEAVALDDAGLESSDFDLALDEGDAPSADESGSEVLALPEEDQPVPKRAGRGLRKTLAVPPKADVDAGATSDFDSFGADAADAEVEVEVGGAFDAEVEIEPEVEIRTVVKDRLLPGAPWGLMPVLLMVPCVAAVVVVALLGFEMVQSMSGYKSPGLVTRTLNDLVNPKSPLK